jgi:hypothetical protein
MMSPAVTDSGVPNVIVFTPDVASSDNEPSAPAATKVPVGLDADTVSIRAAATAPFPAVVRFRNFTQSIVPDFCAIAMCALAIAVEFHATATGDAVKNAFIRAGIACVMLIDTTP